METAVETKNIPALMWEVSVNGIEGKRPSMIWRRTTLSILSILDHWIEMGRWWQGQKTAELFLVDTSMGVFLLWHESESEQWYAKPIR